MLLNAVMAQNKATIWPANDAKKTTMAASETTSATSPEALLLAVAGGDKAAFVRLFEHFAPRIKSYLMKGGTPEDAADELAQETMIAAWKNAGTYDPAKAAASTWIFTIARNKRIDSLRGPAARHGVDIEHAPPAAITDPALSAPQALIRAQETEYMARAINDLPEDQATLIRQSFFEGKSHADIAQEQKIPLGTVKSRIRLALNRLRNAPSVRTLWAKN